MARDNPHRPFTPKPEQMARAPGVSGNAINGLGETAFRPPRMVYWAPDPNDIPHGGMQRFFYLNRPAAQADRDAQDEIRSTRAAVLDAPLSPLADTRARRSPRDWTAALDQFVQAGDCEQVGATPINPDWFYEGQSAKWRNIIVLAVMHDYQQLRDAPADHAGIEVTRQYTRAAATCKKIASWLRQQGWDAEPVTGPMTGSITLIPPALACGFGELGKHGSIISDRMGANFRLSAVMTDAPFAATAPQTFGVDAFCANCRICEDACPPEALAPEKQTVRGTTKWYVDFDRCLPYFNEHQGCAICIAVCPWSRPGVGLNLAAKLARRAERLDPGRARAFESP